ncbi:MAG: serine hydrolase domain-containing protein [Gemmataceae bacterium]
MNRRHFLGTIPAAFLLPRLRADEGGSVAEGLKPFVNEGNLAGAVTLVANKDKVLDLGAVGFADIGAKEPLKTDAVFWIASMSKPITATALMLLVDEGMVNLDDPVEKYLPEFKNVMVLAEKTADTVLLKKPKTPPTVRSCLSHTSGMPFASAMEVPTIDVLPLRDAVRSYAITPLIYEPHTKHVYSNAGINTAGRIVEVVSKMPFEAFLDKRLFGPCGMTDTTFWPNAEQVKRLAKSYKPGADKKGLEATTVGALKYPLSERKDRFPCPGGGLFSTAADCGKFCQMLLNGGKVGDKKLISEEAIAEMSKKQTPDPINVSYGLGWAVGPGWFGHGGAYSTNMTIDTKRGLVFVFMVQHAGFPGNGGQSQGAFRKAAEAKYGPK